ncbi:MAG: MFS transporter [Chitinophagaceae bacterium]
MTSKTGSQILPVIVIAQVCCVSLWFAGNAVMPGLVSEFRLDTGAFTLVTSAVQLGFIAGTFVFALFTIADRYPPSKVFFICALAGSVLNAAMVIGEYELSGVLFLRFSTGFCLAGIYPVGMKIAADYHEKGLGKALGYLVGALVLGTALPHLLKAFSGSWQWRFVMLVTSALALFGGLLVLVLVPDASARKTGSTISIRALRQVFKNRSLRSAAFGYFGHMWELYAFWAFVPFMLVHFRDISAIAIKDIALLSFIIIASGAFACVASGYLAQRFGAKKVAFGALLCSGACGLLSPLVFMYGSQSLFLLFLIIWGMTVIADSPLFSTLVAQSADAGFKGTALIAVTCIGFAITIISIQLIGYLTRQLDANYIFMVLAIGPAAGLWALWTSKRQLK